MPQQIFLSAEPEAIRRRLWLLHPLVVPAAIAIVIAVMLRTGRTPARGGASAPEQEAETAPAIALCPAPAGHS